MSRVHEKVGYPRDLNTFAPSFSLEKSMHYKIRKSLE